MAIETFRARSRPPSRTSRASSRARRGKCASARSRQSGDPQASESLRRRVFVSQTRRARLKLRDLHQDGDHAGLAALRVHLAALEEDPLAGPERHAPPVRAAGPALAPNHEEQLAEARGVLAYFSARLEVQAVDVRLARAVAERHGRRARALEQLDGLRVFRRELDELHGSRVLCPKYFSSCRSSIATS